VEEIVSGGVQRVYVHGHSLISQGQLIGSNWVTSFYGSDGQGSIRFLTDSAYGVTDTYTYDAFGNLIASTGSTPNHYLYQGEQLDPDLAFYYLRRRYMNHSTGRFWTMDSFEGGVSDPPSVHRYLYGNGDPINRSDTSGNLSLLEGIGVSSIVGALAGAAIGGITGGWRGALYGGLAGAVLGPVTDYSSDSKQLSSAPSQRCCC
jgi:RHS repeat-associated protein